MKKLPPKHLLDLLLEYDPLTGNLTWKPRNNPAFDNKHVGKEALVSVAQGYKRGLLNKQMFAAHRVIFKMMTGRDPSGIDHINGDTMDNRWINLREADQSVNQKNQKLALNNRSGKSGVSFNVRSQKWTASISDSGKRIFLGSFKNKQDAIQARTDAEIKYKYHPNHGKR